MNVLERFAAITTFIFDIDGVLTDGTILVFPGNSFVRRMNIKDGYSLQLAIKKGYKIAVITGSHAPAVQERLSGLGIEDVYQKIEHKKDQVSSYMAEHNLNKKEVLFMGDDIPDLDAMQLAGLACCPADAVTEVKTIADYISPWGGGMGCVRDVIEKVLKINGHWDADTTVASK
ncbi:MAG TPA: HAD family hydrolase [Agriterribacter sp.]|nr:HAD family hydrolase [Agriterribacter sp.]